MRNNRGRWDRTTTLLVGASVVIIVIALVVAGGARVTTQPKSPATSTAQVGSQRLSGPIPVPRGGSAMAFDAHRGEVILFGGTTNGGAFVPPLTDTWVLRGRRWAQLNPRGHPPGMAEQFMVFDERTQTCLLVGLPSATFGPSSGQVAGETWNWDGANWMRLSDVPFTGFETLDALAADPTTGHVVLLSTLNAAPGGSTAAADIHTWTWDGQRWTLRHPPQPFPTNGTTGPILATVEARAPARLGCGVLAIFASANDITETWFWDGSTWSRRAAGSTPPYTPLGSTMAEDPNGHNVVLIGLQQAVGAGDNSTWLWDGTTWTEAAPAPNVETYGATSVLADRRTGHAIVIGDQPSQLDILWTWDGRSWVNDRAA